MLQKCSIYKTAGIFFNEPTKEHYLKEISRKAKLAHTSVKQHLKSLKSLSIITETKEKKGTRSFPIYKANLYNNNYKKYKRMYNLNKLMESGIINHIKDNFMPNSIILFGSFQKGEDIEDSDIDIFVESKEKKIELGSFSKKLDRKIQLHFKENFKDYPKELRNNIINGLILEGYLEAY